MLAAYPPHLACCLGWEQQWEEQTNQDMRLHSTCNVQTQGYQEVFEEKASLRRYRKTLKNQLR
jgi:hypothetical protein